MITRKKVLVACEFSGVVREAFARLGHDAWSCDMLDTEIPGQHLKGDALAAMVSGEWDMVLAFPPCTYLTNSGVRWLYGASGGTKQIDPVRWAQMEAGARFFRSFFNYYAGPVCVENPTMHGHAAELIPADLWELRQRVQPWMFGHMESKATMLHLRGLPALVPTNNVRAEMDKLPKAQTQRVWLCPPGPDRWMMRSRTFPGIAEAMAAQWGGRVTAKTFAGINSAAVSRPTMAAIRPQL